MWGWRDDDWNTLCHSCGFVCQQRVLKTFPDPGYLRSEDGVVYLWHLLVSLYIYIIYNLYIFNSVEVSGMSSIFVY